MTENNFNSERFHHSILLNKAAGEVFALFGLAGGLEKWFQCETIFTATDKAARKPGEMIQKDDSFYWKWLAKDFSIEGKVINVTPGISAEFTFGSLFNIKMSAAAQNGRTLFTIEQWYTNGAIKNDFAYINCCTCWIFFLTNLKSVLEHGIDLRETTSTDEALVNR